MVVSDSVLSGVPPGNKLENGDNYPDGALIRSPDFIKNEWYVFLGSSQEILDNQHDEVKLADKDGNLIDSYSY